MVYGENCGIVELWNCGIVELWNCGNCRNCGIVKFSQITQLVLRSLRGIIQY